MIRYCRRLSLYSLMFLGVFFTSVAYAESAQDLEKLKALKESIEALKIELKATQGARNNLLQNLEKSEKDISELSEKAKELERTKAAEEQKLNQLNQERDQLLKKKNDQQKLVADYINSAYRIGQTSQLQLLLTQQSPSDVSRTLTYYQYFVSARASKITAYLGVIGDLELLEPQIKASTANLDIKIGALNQQKRDVKVKQDQRAIMLVKLESELTSSKQKLQSLQKNRSRLEALISRVSEYIGDIDASVSQKSFDKLKGALPFPTKGRIVNRYGSSRVANRIKWQGIMIEANPGTDVKAIHSGRVVFSDYLRGHGLLIILDHGGGYMSLYAHNESIYKEIGGWVAGGDVIASVGNSGGQQKNALYFELRYKGTPTNPMTWFKSA